MIDEGLCNRLTAYVPEVLNTVTEEVKLQIGDFIKASVVSVDFAYVNSAETAHAVLANVLSEATIKASGMFIQNVIRFGKMCDPEHMILKNYYTPPVIPILEASYPALIALAYLNAGHAGALALMNEVSEAGPNAK